MVNDGDYPGQANNIGTTPVALLLLSRIVATGPP